MKIIRIFYLCLFIIFNSCETSSSVDNDKSGISDSNKTLETNRDTFTSGYYEENNNGINKQYVDTLYSGNYYSDEVINSQGILLNLLNEKELFNDNGSLCFVGGRKYKFKIDVFGISQKAKLKNITFSTGNVVDVDSTERTFVYIPPNKSVKVNVDYSIEARIFSIERIVDSTEKKGYKEMTEFIDGLFDKKKLQVCR